METPILQASPQRWVCAKGCPEYATTYSARVPMHECRELHGLNVPLIHEGTKAKVETREREDYINDEHVQLIEGRPVMNAVITRDDGEDCTVLAPLAVGSIEEII